MLVCSWPVIGLLNQWCVLVLFFFKSVLVYSGPVGISDQSVGVFWSCCWGFKSLLPCSGPVAAWLFCEAECVCRPNTAAATDCIELIVWLDAGSRTC